MLARASAAARAGAVVAGHGFGGLGRSPQSAAQPSAPITALRLSIDSNCRLKTSCVAGLTFASRSSTEASFVTHSTSVSAAGRASFAADRRHRLRLWVVGRAGAARANAETSRRAAHRAARRARRAVPAS